MGGSRITYRKPLDPSLPGLCGSPRHISTSNTVAVTGELTEVRREAVLFCFSNQYVNINCSYTLFNTPHSFFMSPYKHIKGTMFHS